MASHFFETSVTLITFVLGGKWMQALAVKRTSQALSKLMQLQAKTAVKITPLQAMGKFDPLVDRYEEHVVDIEQIQMGDMVKVIRGASVPADGKIVAGEVSIDESMVTGESVPVFKTPGSVVIGGTICVEAAGAAFVEVTGVGSSTALAQIVQLVSDAQTRAVPVQAYADKIASIFVPVVCVVSVLTFAVWYTLIQFHVVPEEWYRGLGEDPLTFAIMFGIACLVISCPCALGLATPTAVMSGTGVGASLGVLIKGGEALETASHVDAVIFDKTGTLTKGTPAVVDFSKVNEPKGLSVPQGVTMDDYVLWLFASLEKTSEHPLAAAVVKYADRKIQSSFLNKNQYAQPAEFQAVTGRGASAVVAGVRVAAGNRAFCGILGIPISGPVEQRMALIENEGKTAILGVINGQVVVVMGIADEVKPEAKSSIAYLRKQMNVDVWMVTGDNRRTAHAISRQLGLPSNRVIAEAMPATKVEQVRRLQSEGFKVAMIGDGVNDSPALAQADIGMSIGSGAEIAAEASDMVLVKGAVSDVVVALHLSRVIFRRIQLNLLWSLLYNCLGVPVAAGVFFPLIQTRLPPTVAALAMALSSVSVVLSSLALRLYRPPSIEKELARAQRGWWGQHRRASVRSQLEELEQPLLLHSHGSSSSYHAVGDDSIETMEHGCH